MRSTFPTILLLAAAAAGCTTGERGSRRPRGVDPVRYQGTETTQAQKPQPARVPQAGDPGVIPGTPSIRIVWEALYVEQEAYRNSTLRARETGERRSSGTELFGKPDFEVILVNASFVPTPEQDKENRAQVAVGRLARVPDKDLVGLVVQLESLGFFKHAKPTEAVRPFFGSDRARGRITVERGGESLTLVSYRGLGLQAATKMIPEIYAAGKLAIQVLKNRSPSISVRDAKFDPLRPKDTNAPPAAGSGEATPATPRAAGTK